MAFYIYKLIDVTYVLKKKNALYKTVNVNTSCYPPFTIYRILQRGHIKDTILRGLLADLCLKLKENTAI